jgi:hypothetical protein
MKRLLNPKYSNETITDFIAILAYSNLGRLTKTFILT